jgi:hypothetical protein
VSTSGPSLVVSGSVDEPPVFAGPPGRLAGRIDLRNPGRASVVLRDAGLKDTSGVLRLPTARQALRPFVLRPDQAGSVQLTIAVDPATPSGDYRAELDVAGEWLAVVLRVAEVLETKVEPHTLVVFNQLDVAQCRRLLVTNAGNVPFSVGDPGPVDLHVDNREDEVVRVALDPLLRGGKPDLEGLVLALLAVAREEPRHADALGVEVPDGPVEIRPGQSVFVELEITLRKELSAQRRYRGLLPILTRDVAVVVAAGGTVEPERPRRPRARPRTAAAAAVKPDMPPPPRSRRRSKATSDPQRDEGATP